MTTLLQLASEMSRLRVAIPKIGDFVAKETARKIHTDLVKETPVDTSRALSNWTINIGRKLPAVNIEFGGYPAYYPGTGGSTESASENLAITIMGVYLDLKKPGKKIFIQNTIDYIGKLNTGSSPQAESMFIEDIITVGFWHSFTVDVKRFLWK